MTRLLDLINEFRITRARNRFLRNPGPDNYRRFAELLRGRSAAQVARMERHRGLA